MSFCEIEPLITFHCHFFIIQLFIIFFINIIKAPKRLFKASNLLNFNCNRNVIHSRYLFKKKNTRKKCFPGHMSDWHRYRTFIQKKTTPQNYISFADNIKINNMYTVTKVSILQMHLCIRCIQILLGHVHNTMFMRLFCPSDLRTMYALRFIYIIDILIKNNIIVWVNRFFKKKPTRTFNLK